MKRRRAKPVAAMMLSRLAQVGEMLEDSEGRVLMVTQRLTRDLVRCREVRWRERWSMIFKGWWYWAVSWIG